MNLDVGEVLTRAWQITWKHKVLWVFNMFPALIGFLFFLIVLIPMFFLGPNSLVRQGLIDRSSYTTLFIFTDIFLIVLSILLYAAGSASASLGIWRIENGMEQLRFHELFQDGLKYFWRTLWVTLLIAAGTLAVFLFLFGCWLLVRMATMGWGLICLQPLFVLIYPALLLVYALTEESQAAVVVENTSVIDALVRGWLLVKSHFWKFVLISILIYFGIFVLSSILTLPLLAPFFFLTAIAKNAADTSNFQSSGGNLMFLSLIVLPILALVLGLALTFMKSAYMIVYLRLTRSSTSQTTLQQSTA